MLFKIIWRSFLKQTRNYIVYFSCMTFSVMIFYSFSAMTYDQPLSKRASQDIQVASVLTLGNVVVAIVILLFMLSANRFFIQQKQKEIGLYQLFGLRKWRIIYQFMLETVIINIFSLIVGMLMGIIFSKFFAMILIKAMALNISSGFFVAWQPVATTIGMFLIALILIAAQNAWLIWQKSLLELFSQKNYFSSQNMVIRWPKYLWALLSLFVIGLSIYIFLNFSEIISIYMQETDDQTAVIWLPFLVLGLWIAGINLFFGSSLQVILFLLTKWRQVAYRRLRFLTLNDVRKNLQSSWRTLVLITVIIGISITMIGSAIGLFSLTYRVLDWNYPTDFQIRSEDGPYLEELIKKNGGKVSEKVVIPYKAVGFQIKNLNRPLDNQSDETIEIGEIMSETAFRKLQTVLPNEFEHTTLPSDGALLFDSSYIIKSMNSHPNQSVVLPNGITLQVQSQLPNILGTSSLRYGVNVVVVRDEIYHKVEGVEYQITYLNTMNLKQEKFQQTYLINFPASRVMPITYQYQFQNGQIIGTTQKAEITHANQETSNQLYRLNQSSRYPNVRATRRQGGIFLYVALFVGMIVLMTTTSSLMLRQFYQIGREKKKYQLLTQLGIPKSELHRSLYLQNSWVFFPPMIIATAQGSFVLYLLTQLFEGIGVSLAYLFCFITIFLFVVAYFVTTIFSIRILEE